MTLGATSMLNQCRIMFPSRAEKTFRRVKNMTTETYGLDSKMLPV